MDHLLIASAALLASALTLFSGFGLGTLLMPVMAVFFPVDTAVALTAVVHLLNNLFKLALLGRHAGAAVVWRFGVPAMIAAFGGAAALAWLANLQPLLTYRLGTLPCEVTTAKLVIAVLMVVFALWEWLPALRRVQFGRRALPIGGVLSGFFGGLSGHQGALRSAFLLRCGLSKEGFIATGVAIACLVDASRLLAYSTKLAAADLQTNSGLLITAVVAAFLGAFVGTRLIKKVTIQAIQTLVSLMLFGLAGLLAAGLI